MKRWIGLGLLASAAVGGCGPAPDSETESPSEREAVRVATLNLYVGTDLTHLLAGGTPDDIPRRIAAEFGSIAAARFPERAEALAAELAADPPHLIGVQEMTLLRIESPGDFLNGNANAAADTVLDFQSILLEALAQRGLNYMPAAAYVGMDVEVPMLNDGGGIDDIRLTDRGVVLAREDVRIVRPRWSTYRTKLQVRVGGENGLPVDLTGGWASVDATIGSRTFRFVTTHLESGDLAPEIQIAQAAELLAVVDTATLPVFLVGDFSSTPDGAMTPTYAEVLGAGFADLWRLGSSANDGATCCQAPDLRNPSSQLSRRLDLIFYRDVDTEASLATVGSVELSLIGADPERRTPSGLWPSDHAGVAITLSPDP